MAKNTGLVERVARAICLEDRPKLAELWESEKLAGTWRNDYRDQARAAIAAVLKDLARLDAGTATRMVVDSCHLSTDGSRWRAMLTAYARENGIEIEADSAAKGGE